MKKCNRKPIQKQLPIEVQFTGKELTAHAGILPLHKFCNKLGLSSLLEKYIQLHEAPTTVYPTAQIIQATVYGLLAGHKRINQIESFSQDPLIRRILELPDKLDEDTISRRFKKFSMRTTSAFSALQGLLSKRIHQHLQTEEDILDLDSSVSTVYGFQEGARKGYNPKKKGARSYHPLFAFLNSTKECLRFYLRPGNTSSSNNASGLVNECMASLSGSVKRLFVRADSGFFDGELLEMLEQHHRAERRVTYVIKVRMRDLKRLLELQDWEPIVGKPGWESAAFYHQCSTWEESRRFVALRTLDTPSETETLFPLPTYRYVCYVTNSPDHPHRIHEFYGDRGESENWIEAVKNQLFGGCMVTQDFWANEALWLCSVLAYNLSVWYRILIDRTTWREEPQTFRYWFINLAGKVVRHGRKYIVKLYHNFHRKECWMGIYEKGVSFEFG